MILVGDGVKPCKEGLYIPGVKKLHQESEDSSKAEYMSIQDGISAAASWEGSTGSGENRVLQMIGSGYETAMFLGRSIMLLDRYFLTATALKKLKKLNTSCTSQVILG